MTKRLVLFNHKGGVSKTTTVYNLGWMLSEGARVLLVDGDPQCNLSSLLLGDEFEKYYIDPATQKQNIKDGVSAAFTGKPFPISAVNCFSPARARNLHLLAGHANLSEYEASLSLAQNSRSVFATLQSLPGAFNALIQRVEEKYEIDYTLIDLNPSLSAINQNLFLLCDLFVIPTNPDPFSVMALETVKTFFPLWAAWKKEAIVDFAETAYPLRSGLPRFGGSFIQRFNVRKGRAAKPYRDNIEEIKAKTMSDLLPALMRAGMTLPSADYPDSLRDKSFCLAEIPDFAGLLPKSQDAGVPVFSLNDDEFGESGTILANMKTRRDQFRSMFEEIASTLIALLKHA